MAGIRTSITKSTSCSDTQTNTFPYLSPLLVAASHGAVCLVLGTLLTYSQASFRRDRREADEIMAADEQHGLILPILVSDHGQHDCQREKDRDSQEEQPRHFDG